MKKQPKRMGRPPNYEVFFENRGGEGPLSLYFSPGPYGNAVEAIDGTGIGFFDETGTLLAVQFDKLVSSADSRTLRFTNGTWVEVTVKKGMVKVKDARLSPSSESAPSLLR